MSRARKLNKRKGNKMKLVILVSVLAASFLVSSAALAETDNKYHSEYVLKTKLNDKFDLFFTPEFRAKNDMGNIYYYHLRAGSTFHADKHLDLAGAYRYIQTQDASGDWSNNDAQYIEFIVIPKTKLSGFNLSDANKVEYRFIENAHDRWVYKNLFTVAYPVNISGFEFTPYVSDEIYYDFDIDKVNLNWATVGINKKVMKNLSIGVYGRNEASRSGASSKWTTAHILGSNVAIDF